MQDAKQATPQIGDRVTFDGELWEIISLGTEADGMRYAQLANASRPGSRLGRWLQGRQGRARLRIGIDTFDAPEV